MAKGLRFFSQGSRQWMAITPCCSGMAFRCARTCRIAFYEHFAPKAERCFPLPQVSTQTLDGTSASDARERRGGGAFLEFTGTFAHACLAHGANARWHSMSNWHHCTKGVLFPSLKDQERMSIRLFTARETPFRVHGIGGYHSMGRFAPVARGRFPMEDVTQWGASRPWPNDAFPAPPPGTQATYNNQARVAQERHGGREPS